MEFLYIGGYAYRGWGVFWQLNARSLHSPGHRAGISVSDVAKCLDFWPGAECYHGFVLIVIDQLKVIIVFRVSSANKCTLQIVKTFHFKLVKKETRGFVMDKYQALRWPYPHLRLYC